MNIGAVGAPMPADAVSGASPITGGRFEGQLQGVMNDVTGVLGMSPQQLNAQISRSGSLTSVAGQRGISEQQLIGTITQSLQDAGSKLTGTRLANIATRISRHHGVRVEDHTPSAANRVSSSTLAPGTWKPTAPANSTPV